ncbi:MAG: ribose-phosphate pyrophosphokinase [Candidatus Binatus sp.]|uniref:ribose-phosphate pyrophosphokinase n=1 Tax=Candidatus Binatus sp. TaxID=2811406 RepID=UPI00271C02CB|nr:ribose-phosphate pyrophosphokinase [Candidatus Binatus sp.]MDO8431747.1 ribose-phosphate pyrophosphokinase [Candidatus Binatus sp.]
MSERVKNQLDVFTGNSNPALAREVAEHLGVKLGEAEVGRFPDGEVMVEIRENVRGGDCFVIQSICSPPNENLMELLLISDALRRASAGRITAVIPYFGYSRQDRKVAPRVPISAKVVADLITTAGVHRVLTVDLHAGQIQGFFNIPVDNLYAMPVLINYLRKRVDGARVSVVSPDAGGVERARAFARRLNANLAIIDKRRQRASQIAEMQLVGEVKDSIALLVDDMIDTAGTITEAAKVVANAGASEVIACATHPILSDPACDRLNKSHITEIITTNTIPLRAKTQAELTKLKVLSVGSLLAEAVKRIHNEESVSSLFN